MPPWAKPLVKVRFLRVRLEPARTWNSRYALAAARVSVSPVPWMVRPPGVISSADGPTSVARSSRLTVPPRMAGANTMVSGPVLALARSIADRRLPATLSCRLVTWKTAGTLRSSSASRPGRQGRFGRRVDFGSCRPRAIDLPIPLSQQRIVENAMVISPFRNRSAVDGYGRTRRADPAPGRCRAGEGLAWRQYLAGRLIETRQEGAGLPVGLQRLLDLRAQGRVTGAGAVQVGRPLGRGVDLPHGQEDGTPGHGRKLQGRTSQEAR